ncbi:ATP-binding protein [Streptomyces populi]|uniref:histidine kinase n=1 Tax=Streptomyces populi TaxID=2058924 RepID=A0A2I0SMG6_9ACTN|nr:ATP-binding protein [Streptomyces populi]PKT71136.1 ATP-binding protein [Streptomyces populi]
MTPPLPSGERPAPRATAKAVLTAAVPAAAAVVAAVLLAPEPARVPLAWGTGAAALLLCAAVAVAARAVQAERLALRRLDGVTKDIGRLLQERARTAEEFGQERTRLTGEAARERAHAAETAAQERIRLADEAAREHARLTAEFAEERERLTAGLARLTEQNAELSERARQADSNRTAAVSATANAAARMQALSTGMLADLRAMEERHSDEDVLADLLHLDHRTAQVGRLADSIAVLASARSGRRWARPIVMESILRGAMGRIGGYQRVRVHSTSEAAVAGHAAEGVMHALAELLDNAATFSPPTAEVHVYVEEVPAGVIVSVEDSGLVMGDVQLRRAERAVSGDMVNASDLGTGTRLGLAVVGRLARKYGLKVSFRPSARGGTGVLVLIPQDILTQANPPHTAVRPPAGPEPVVAAPAADGGRTSAPGSRDGEGAPEPRRAPDPQESGAPREPAGTAASYAAARAAGDLDPDPVPTHDSPRHEQGPASTGGLPKRRRGRTLAHAERSRSHTAPPEPRTGDDPKARPAARFGTFRQAVRGAAAGAPEPVAGEDPPGTGAHARPEDHAPASTGSTTPTPTTPTALPEGDTTP